MKNTLLSTATLAVLLMASPAFALSANGNEVEKGSSYAASESTTTTISPDINLNFTNHTNDLAVSQDLSAAVALTSVDVNKNADLDHAGNVSAATGGANFSMAGNGIVSAQSQTGYNTAGANGLNMGLQVADTHF